MEHGVLVTDGTLNVHYRQAVYDSRLPGLFGPHYVSPVEGVMLGGGASPEDLRAFLEAPPAILIPHDSHIRVSRFILSLGMGHREVIAACRYRSAVDAVLRGGTPFLRAASEAGWDGDRFATDPVFPKITHGVVLSAVAKRCLDHHAAGDGEDAGFLAGWLMPHAVRAQDGVFASADTPVRTQLLRAVPPRNMTRSTLSFCSRDLLRSPDLAELHRWGTLGRVLRCAVSDRLPLSEEESRIVVDAMRLLTEDQATSLLEASLASGHTGLCRRIVALPFYWGRLETAAWFIRRAIALEEILADCVSGGSRSFTPSHTGRCERPAAPKPPTP